MKLEQGDPIERQEVEWVRENIAPYEEIWRRFIGNDGSNRALRLVASSSDFDKVRDRFNECHYSIFITVIILRRECERYQDNLGEVSSLNSYLDAIRDITCFMTHLGKIRDLFEAIAVSLKMGDSIWRRFEDFYKSRNAIIHGSIVPIQIQDGWVSVPRFETVDHINSVWTSKSIWNDCGSIKYDTLADYMKESMSLVYKNVYSALVEVLDRLKEMMPQATLQELPLQQENYAYLGSEVHCGSALIKFPPPSGVR